MKVWVVLPALNEAENLPEMFEAIASTLSALGGGYTMFEHGHTRGLARAMETALRWVLSRADDPDVIVTMDADNTHPADLLPAMVGAIQGGADVVIASRYAPGGVEKGVPPSRRILSRGIGALMRLRFRLPGVRDYTSGYRAYRARLLRAAAARYGPRLIEAQGFTVTAELLVKLHPFHPRIVEVPVHLRYDRKRGGSKMGVLRTVREYLALLCSRPLGRHAEKGVGA